MATDECDPEFRLSLFQSSDSCLIRIDASLCIDGNYYDSAQYLAGGTGNAAKPLYRFADRYLLDVLPSHRIVVAADTSCHVPPAINEYAQWMQYPDRSIDGYLDRIFPLFYRTGCGCGRCHDHEVHRTF